MELTLIDYNLARKLPSEIAAAALYLSISLIDESEWVGWLVYSSESCSIVLSFNY